MIKTTKGEFRDPRGIPVFCRKHQASGDVDVLAKAGMDRVNHQVFSISFNIAVIEKVNWKIC